MSRPLSNIRVPMLPFIPVSKPMMQLIEDKHNRRIFSFAFFGKKAKPKVVKQVHLFMDNDQKINGAVWIAGKSKPKKLGTRLTKELEEQFFRAKRGSFVSKMEKHSTGRSLSSTEIKAALKTKLVPPTGIKSAYGLPVELLTAYLNPRKAPEPPGLSKNDLDVVNRVSEASFKWRISNEQDRKFVEGIFDSYYDFEKDPVASTAKRMSSASNESTGSKGMSQLLPPVLLSTLEARLSSELSERTGGLTPRRSTFGDLTVQEGDQRASQLTPLSPEMARRESVNLFLDVGSQLGPSSQLRESSLSSQSNDELVGYIPLFYDAQNEVREQTSRPILSARPTSQTLPPTVFVARPRNTGSIAAAAKRNSIKFNFPHRSKWIATPDASEIL